MGGGLNPGENRLQPLVGDVLDIGLAGSDRRHLAGIDIDRNYVLTRLGERDDEWKPHIAKSDNPYRHV
jgi:hypothetical protein